MHRIEQGSGDASPAESRPHADVVQMDLVPGIGKREGSRQRPVRDVIRLKGARKRDGVEKETPLFWTRGKERRRMQRWQAGRRIDTIAASSRKEKGNL